ncbi:MAG TPA: ATP-binding protein [Noviherbaspirillum sp.]|nr:ATP-binding protein [Noviherbaspirillum sp.]
MNNELAPFDRDLSLAELLAAVPRIKLEAALNRTIGESWRITDNDGSVLWEGRERPSEEEVALPLSIDIEMVGRLLAPGTRREQANAAARWLEMVLTGVQRYRMAADLHLEAVHADYQALQAKHAALQASETRYRELSGQLERRVQAQVEVIERTQRQLFVSEKMAAIGSLAAGMAHEINNPIGFIRSNLGTASTYFSRMRTTLEAFRKGDVKQAEAAWQQYDIDYVLEDFSGLLEESVTGADRVARIIANLKAYSSVDCQAETEVDLNDAIRATAGVIREMMPANVSLDMDLQRLPRIMCDLSRMNQVLFALLQNARQALGQEGGWIRVASSVSGDEIRIAISDNGRGIAKDIVPRIFDPFFTTRDVGQGMGLGLTVSNDIVSAHNGRIEVDTAAGKGSTFVVYLPLNRKPIAERGAS